LQSENQFSKGTQGTWVPYCSLKPASEPAARDFTAPRINNGATFNMTSNKPPAPPELSLWAEEVKQQNLRVEKAMVPVVGLAFKYARHVALLLPPDPKGIRDRKVRARMLRKAMHRALAALEQAMRDEYSPAQAAEPVGRASEQPAISLKTTYKSKAPASARA
jgi:hypothetical protein